MDRWISGWRDGKPDEHTDNHTYLILIMCTGYGPRKTQKLPCKSRPEPLIEMPSESNPLSFKKGGVIELSKWGRKKKKNLVP